MSNLEYPALPENVIYIGLDNNPVNEDSPFPEIRFGDSEVLEASEEPNFDFKRAALKGHYRDHIRDLRNGIYDHCWPADKLEDNRAKEIKDYGHKIRYLSW